MGSFIEAGKTGEYQDGSKKRVTIEGQEILLARVGENYYAVSNRCTHLRGRLAAGVLEGKIITCPLHGSQFDVTTGEAVRWLKGTGLLAAVMKVLRPPRPLKTYKVKVDGDTIYIEV